MPNYTFLNTLTNEEINLTMTISEFERYIKDNVHMEQQFNSMNYVNDSWKMGRKKPDDSFRDVLREIKKKHSQGFTKSTVNTW